MNNIKNVLVGPFVGDFKSEIVDFRPYARWIYEVIKPERMFVSTHSNRQFLYEDWAEVIPVYEDFSRDELNQNGLVHNSITQKEMSILSRKIKNDVLKIIYPDKSLFCFNTSYTKSTQWYPLYKKVFCPISIPTKEKPDILFIPYINEKYAIISDIYEHLIKIHPDLIVVGDMKTHLHDNNLMLKNTTYFQDIYYDMVSLITGASIVITPNSHWTVLSIMQDTPVISWGSFPSYYTNERKTSKILSGDIPIENLKTIIDDFIINIIKK